ncbi:MAG: beta-lactamase family protein [Clostridia bacterium]|nr:beta-lactamase family protein [Clostridia bacterium]
MQRLRETVDRLFEEKSLSHLGVKVALGDSVLCEFYRSREGTLDGRTLFDMASVTKILCPTMLALIAVDEGALRLSDPVSRFFSVSSEKEGLTVEHLLTHTMGIGHKNLTEFFQGEIGEYILSIPSDFPIGTKVRYSCPGFVLLGRILEKVFALPLNEAFCRWVAAPLGMNDTGFFPKRGLATVNANLREDLRGTVNDYNCRHLGGVAGNAGIFSHMEDLTKFVFLLRRRGEPLFSAETFALARQNRTRGMDESRGLGFLYVDGRYEQTGGLFPEGSIGHCGHTGQSVFLDPESGLSVILLSDATVSTVKKYGRERYGDVMRMRHDLHAAIKSDLET